MLEHLVSPHVLQISVFKAQPFIHAGAHYECAEAIANNQRYNLGDQLCAQTAKSAILC
jgi:hypothetical protein